MFFSSFRFRSNAETTEKKKQLNVLAKLRNVVERHT